MRSFSKVLSSSETLYLAKRTLIKFEVKKERERRKKRDDHFVKVSSLAKMGFT